MLLYFTDGRWAFEYFSRFMRERHGCSLDIYWRCSYVAVSSSCTLCNLLTISVSLRILKIPFWNIKRATKCSWEEPAAILSCIPSTTSQWRVKCNFELWARPRLAHKCSLTTRLHIRYNNTRTTCTADYAMMFRFSFAQSTHYFMVL